MGIVLRAGGMGIVLRARDTTLDRDVALKVLPEAFSSDPDRLARFEREAKVLASLNHPNIGSIYGLEAAEGIRALVLELVEGPTLADRISKGPIPLDEALPIAKQIAEAIEAAHERGVIHRDLKPANVKVKADGTVKVLDFGLAKAFQPEASGASTSMSPTISLTAAATQMGMVIGTAAYMSPEQARGKPVDRRADIWAFGAVLYEMLTGARPFTGKDVPDTLAAVLRIEADLDALPTTTPPRLRHVLRACLQKEPKDRIRDIGDVNLAMAGTFETPVPETGASVGVPRPQVWQRPASIAATALAALVLGGLAVWTATRPVVVPADLVRFVISPPDTAALDFRGVHRDLAISPDGTRIIYKSPDSRGTAPQLTLRLLDQLDGTPLRGTDGGIGPFVSPDSEWVGFVEYRSGTILQKVSMFGGPPVMLAESPRPVLGASWGRDDQIIFGTRGGGLFRVSGGGGDPEVLTTPEPGESHAWPSIIPGRRAVVFVISSNVMLRNGQLAVLDLDSKHVTRLRLAGVSPRYVSSGHLVYAVDDGSMQAVGFDAASLETNGNPVPLLEGVNVKLSGAAAFSLSDNGRLVYARGAVRGEQRTLVWVSREGEEERIAAPPREYLYPRISPDGRRVALDDRGDENPLWVWDLAQETLTRLIVGEDGAAYPVWTRDAARLAYVSGRNFYWKASNNTGAPELLAEAPGGMASEPPSPYFFTPDGTGLVFRDQQNSETGDDLHMLSLGDQPATVWSLAGTSSERNAELSPDGQWMAYESDESGQPQIYVRPFPLVEDDLVQVSNNRGRDPVWSPGGGELFYLQPGAPWQLISVSVESAGTDRAFALGDRTVVLDWPYSVLGDGRNYDVSPDGRRFLAIKPVTSDGEPAATTAQINVVLNWIEELKERVPID